MNNSQVQRDNNQEIIAIAKGAGIVLLGFVLGFGFKYLFQIIIARYLGPRLFGLFVLGDGVFRISVMIAQFGLPFAIVRYVALFQGQNDERHTKGIIVSAIRLSLVSSIIAALLIIIFSKGIAENVFHSIELTNVLRIFALAIPITTLTTIFVHSTQGFKIMKYKVIVREIIEPLSKIILVVIIFILSFKLYGVLVAYLISSLFGMWLSFHYLRKTFPQITRKQVHPIQDTRKILKFSWPLFFSQFFGHVLLWTDVFFLGRFCGLNEVGIYGAAQKTALIGTMILGAFNAVFGPIISDLFNRKELTDLSNHFKIISKWIFTLNFPVLLILIFFARPILNIFGDQYTHGSISLIILCIGWFIHSSVGPVFQMNIMTGRPILSFINNTSMLLLNIVLNILLVPKYGIIGASLATAVSVGLVSIATLLEVYYFLNMHPYIMDFLKPIISGIVSSAGLFILKQFGFLKTNLFHLLIGIVVFLLLYGILLLLFGFGEEEKIVVNKMKAKFLSN
jgi:O-antigen/teichoic acid export membrane protein